MWLVGNIFSFIASILLAVSLFSKDKKSMMKYQIVNCIFCIISSIFLSAYSGTCSNTIALIRDILEYLKKNTIKKTILLVILLIIVASISNNRGLIGYTPVIASLIFTFTLVFTENIVAIKISLLANNMLWLVYTIIILDIPSSISSCIMIILNIYSIVYAVRIKRGNIQTEQSN